ncbi:hypothetical protein C4565_06500 [Candidatus Parcubacteria bacterium]|jgi:hypothetical protein|nr:MAG: hypothetical protein C4565_06500 [Candidatus Parcubacteria bacterium]
MEARRFFGLVFMFFLGLLVGYLIFNNTQRKQESILEPSQQKIRIEKTISEIEVNEFGYTVPWAVSYDGNSYRVNPDYTVHTETGGTVTMLLKRSKDGYHAYPKEKIEQDGVHWMNGVDVKVHY